MSLPLLVVAGSWPWHHVRGGGITWMQLVITSGGCFIADPLGVTMTKSAGMTGGFFLSRNMYWVRNDIECCPKANYRLVYFLICKDWYDFI